MDHLNIAINSMNVKFGAHQLPGHWPQGGGCAAGHGWLYSTLNLLFILYDSKRKFTIDFPGAPGAPGAP